MRVKESAPIKTRTRSLRDASLYSAMPEHIKMEIKIARTKNSKASDENCMMMMLMVEMVRMVVVTVKSRERRAKECFAQQKADSDCGGGVANI